MIGAAHGEDNPPARGQAEKPGAERRATPAHHAAYARTTTGDALEDTVWWPSQMVAREAHGATGRPEDNQSAKRTAGDCHLRRGLSVTGFPQCLPAVASSRALPFAGPAASICR
jgi:hypothetical protein